MLSSRFFQSCRRRSSIAPGGKHHAAPDPAPRGKALAACLLLAACTATPTAGPDKGHDIQVSSPGLVECSAPSPQVVQSGLNATNRARSRAGLPALQADALLSQAAAAHACDMAQRGRMSHAGSRSSGPAQRLKALGYAPRITAENIAAGPYGTEQVLGEWNSSSGHLANILIPQLRQFGIGHATGADGRTRFWSAVYAAPAGR
ncbi:CAP domain-containing protein [Paracoccus pantotrophus]|uniref:CAP domain-containing protein n=1 Tax=Paracoccus pantotrophus TaxID=82367 RepID=UPI001FCB7CFF|nr:CAP domain-containing protein [Paracoccus pantotrophus]